MSTQKIEIGDYVFDAIPPGTSRPVASATLKAIASRASLWLADYIRQRAFRCAEKELMALDDRMLRDIGLRRSEIGSAVRNPEQERLNGARPLASSRH
ncbi:MAG: DUF1127 domain-containing protein [Hyphomicrobiaceae bacterium]